MTDDSICIPILPYSHTCYVISQVVSAGGIKYANEKMNQYRDEALRILYEFENNEVRAALEELVRFTTDRKY